MKEIVVTPQIGGITKVGKQSRTILEWEWKTVCNIHFRDQDGDLGICTEREWRAWIRRESSKMEPCSHCGLKPVLTHQEEHRQRAYVVCPNCGTSGAVCENDRAAIGAWNKLGNGELVKADR